MEKGAFETIFQIVFVFIILIVILKFATSFVGATPELSAVDDFKGLVEEVCADGGQTAKATVFYLPIENGYRKLHLTTEKVEVYNCADRGPGCAGGTLIKEKALDCPPGLKYTDCWVAPSSEQSVQVTVLKESKAGVITISLNESSEVFC